MNEVFDYFDKELTDDDKEQLKQYPAIKFHHTLGRWIRNNFELWTTQSELKAWLIDKSFTHPDDMSNYIIEEYQKHLKMKTDLSKQTKYFKQVFNQKTLKFDLEEIPLGRNTWWYVQVDSSIRYAFFKYDLQIPKYVVVEDVTHYITFKIYRENIKNIKELQEYNEKLNYVLDELKSQAECNSSDEYDAPNYWVKYEFKIM